MPPCAVKLVRVRCSTRCSTFQHGQERRRPVEHLVEEVHPGLGSSCGVGCSRGGWDDGSELAQESEHQGQADQIGRSGANAEG